MPAPIVFLQSGGEEYEKYTLDCARLFNREAAITILGDASTAYLTELRVEHALWHGFQRGERIEKFTAAAAGLAAPEALAQLRKWFVLENFIAARRLTGFWLFESDTVLCSCLAHIEPRLAGFRCAASQIDARIVGYVQDPAVVSRVCDALLEAVHHEAVRTALAARGAALNEEGFFRWFWQSAGIACAQLNEPLAAERLRFEEDLRRPDGMCLAADGQKLLVMLDGDLYVRDAAARKFVRLLSLRLAGYPLYAMSSVCRYALNYFPRGFEQPQFVQMALGGGR